MIYINNLSINSDSTSLNLNVNTNINSRITKILLWNQNTFKDYNSAIDLSYRLEQINNREIFDVSSEEININDFSGIWFLEITSNSEEDSCNTCQNNIIGVAANLDKIKTFILDKILKLQDCNGCTNSNDDLENIINAYLINKGICSSLQMGYYDEAIFLYKKLLKLLNPELNCNNCRSLRTPIYNNTLNFGTLDNNLILI